MNVLRRWLLKYRNRHDSAWAAAYEAHGGHSEAIGTYDFTKAVDGKKRASQRQQKARKLAAQIGPTAKQPAAVVSIRRTK